MSERLFVYGTLKDPKIQALVFGRVTPGKLDTLAGYRKASIRLGRRVFPIIKPEAGNSVEGMVITVSPAELKQIDRYEGQAYRRQQVTLGSGRRAWVYQA
jgi:gamma-glutamylcyclotransferase (GGCT)/AIG2-like uncharacterized protein YtfP